MQISISAIIPAAGNSTRMGGDKALLSIREGVTFAGHLVNCFGVFGCKPVILIVNEKSDPSRFQSEQVITVVNHALEKGRSWSLLLGLKQVPADHACFIQNVDNPFLDPELLDLLIGSLPADGYAVPVFQGRGGHPILLGSKAVDLFRLKEELPDFRQVLQQMRRTEVDFPDERILWNINTPHDYKQFLHWRKFSR